MQPEKVWKPLMEFVNTIFEGHPSDMNQIKVVEEQNLDKKNPIERSNPFPQNSHFWCIFMIHLFINVLA